MMIWNKLLKEKKWHKFFEDPHPIVIPFAEKLNNNGKKSVVDIGCGIGRHCHLLKEYGFNVYGCDSSTFGVSFTKKRLGDKLSENIVETDMTELPWSNGCFDIGICINVIYHGTYENGFDCLFEIKRVLKKGAPLLLTFLSSKDPEYGNGNLIEPNTFVFAEGYEKGVIHHFYTKSEISSIATLFDNCSYYEKTFVRGPEAEEGIYWVLEGTKP